MMALQLLRGPLIAPLLIIFILSLKAAGAQKESSDSKAALLKDPPTPIYLQYIDPAGGFTAESLISKAFENSRELLAARQNLAIIRGRLIQAGLRPNPTIDTEYGTDKLGTNDGEYDFRAGYVQPIELGGKRGKRLRVVQLELEQAEKEIAFQEKQLAAQIQSQYAEARAAAENLRTTEQLLVLNQETMRVTEVRLKEGDVPRLDLNLVRVEVNRLRAQQLQVENRIRTALIQLKTVAGLALEEPLKLSGKFVPADLPDSPTLEALQTTALENRADLQSARLGEEVAEARIGLAEVEAIPNLDIFGRFEQEKTLLDNFQIGRMNNTDRKVAFGFSIPLPLFNKNQGGIAEAAAARVQARHRREFLEQVVRRDVAVAHGRLQVARETVKLYEAEIIPRAEDNLKIIRVAYDLGDQQLLNVIAEQRRLIEAQQQYIDEVKELYLSAIELQRATGLIDKK